MRDWNLLPGDPLFLTLAADFRLCSPDYHNDHIWELEPGGGDPPAMALRTTYGLRARSMRIFPRYILNGQAISDPATFSRQPSLRLFTPNFMQVDHSPFPGLEVSEEYWVPDSHCIAGRLTIVNRNPDPLSLIFEICGQLVPLDGQSLAPVVVQSANVLAGRTADLAPVIFITGAPQVGQGPYPALTLDLALASGGTRTFTWVQAALADPGASLELARQVVTRPWAAERAKIELVNNSQMINIHTGDPDWDAALTFSQVAAMGLFLGSRTDLAYPGFVLSRQPDHGCSLRGDGLDHANTWSGASPIEADYIAGLLPGVPGLLDKLVKNFLAVQSPDGSVDLRPGMTGQRSHWLATPFLAAMAWKAYQKSGDLGLLAETFPGLLAFHQQWFTHAHDRDDDGFPEWDNPGQAGFDEHPAFNVWHDRDMGASITAFESPALAALLCRDAALLAKMAALLKDHRQEALELEASRLGAAAEECWDAEAVLYHYRDRDTHLSFRGKQVARQRGNGKILLNTSFVQPTRLLVQVHSKGGQTRSPEVIIKGKQGKHPCTEHFRKNDLTWGPGLAAATCREPMTTLTSLEVRGLGGNDRVSIHSLDYTVEDVSLFLPLWAGIPAGPRGRTLINRTLLAAERFWMPFGIPDFITHQEGKPAVEATPVVHMTWNTLVGEALLIYGMRTEAAQLTARLMTAVIETLKQQHAFSRAYHAGHGTGIGERNALHGLAPVGLFLQTLGVEVRSPRLVVLSGKNPFPWPITVQYRGLTVTRHAEHTEVTFPDGQSLTLTDPTDAVVSAD